VEEAASGSPLFLGVREIRTVEEAAAYLERLINVEKQPGLPYERLGLEPVRELLARLDDPHHQLPVIHVGGSKGKGSTVLFIESIARAAGLRVGAFTSPHLERWTERFRIGGAEVPDDHLIAAVERLRPHVDALRTANPGAAPTFFDATTAAAFLLFAEARVDCAVIEVGLGGRLDSTNVVAPVVTCVTSIELEHTDTLGDNLAAIAREKAGILKPGVPVVAGLLPPPARVALLERAKAIGTRIAWLGSDFDVEVCEAGSTGLSLRWLDGPLVVDARVPVIGEHQAANAAMAAACIRRTRWLSDDEVGPVVATGLAAAVLPGRVEILGRSPWRVVDSAHTNASVQALVRALGMLPHRSRHLVLSVSAGKDMASMLRALLPGAASVTVTRAEPTRSLPPETLAAAVRTAAPNVSLRVVPDPRRAVAEARANLASDDLLCATGSVYLAGIARRVLRQEDRPRPAAVGRRKTRAAHGDP
jgi:dihydrofolate synthase/folylpolyglutamate synthase